MVIKNYRLIKVLKKLLRILLLVLFANIFIFLIIFLLSFYNSKNEIKKNSEEINTSFEKEEQKSETTESLPIETIDENKKLTAVITPTITPKVNVLPKDNEPWGVAKQIDDVTWTMKVGEDERIGTPQEIFEALNVYRKQHNKGQLAWDQNLADFAQERADLFDSIKNTDKHAGFKNCMENEDCASKLGRNYIGENSAYGYKLYGVHLIEWIFAGDEPHNTNQLDTKWVYVGVGVKGLGIDIIFGT